LKRSARLLRFLRGLTRNVRGVESFVA
jgi:hypothetical protein